MIGNVDIPFKSYPTGYPQLKFHSANVRSVPEADIFFEPELAKFCQYQNR